MTKIPNIILFDGVARQQLLPLTFTRPIADLRIGILTIREKWALLLGADCSSSLTVNYLRPKYPFQTSTENLFINANILPNKKLANRILQLKPNQALTDENYLIALRTGSRHQRLLHKASGDWRLMLGDETLTINWKEPYTKISHTWDIFHYNAIALQADFDLITTDRTSAAISSTNTIIGSPQQIFIEEGASVEGAFLNTKAGPIYIGKNAVVMEGSMIRGGFALCEHAVVKMGAKIYGATTIGPYCKVGGEINNSVFIGYANKGHDGFLGNSVIGEWCNLGADTNNSNLKNNYGQVRVWHYPTKTFKQTDLQFCGLVMGDYAKSGINTMFNTGTIVGVAANVFGSGFPDKFIPSFTWGGLDKLYTHTHNFHKAVATAKLMFSRRNKQFEEVDQDILWAVFQETEIYRYWENEP